MVNRSILENYYKNIKRRNQLECEIDKLEWLRTLVTLVVS